MFGVDVEKIALAITTFSAAVIKLAETIEDVGNDFASARRRADKERFDRYVQALAEGMALSVLMSFKDGAYVPRPEGNAELVALARRLMQEVDR